MYKIILIFLISLNLFADDSTTTLKTKDMDNKPLSSEDKPNTESIDPAKASEMMKTINDYKLRREEEKKILEELDREDP